jgi:ubiquinone/menaquinone biosynthesis C-methylase UbiE
MQDLIRGYYDKRAAEEWERHDRHRMEFAISRRLLERHLPAPGAILDCGGGPGRYSLWLAAKGYNVTLFDLSSGNLDKARTEAATNSLALRFEQGTATDLRRFEDASFDAVLLMGPLYHLFALDERQTAVAEAACVLRPGGVLAAAFLNRTAPLRYVAKEESGRVLELYQPMINVIERGYDDTFPPADDDHFHAYFSHPAEIEPLLRGAGLEPIATYSAEGFVSMIDEAVNQAEGEAWDAWVDLNLRVASDPHLFLCAEHLLAFARKEGT